MNTINLNNIVNIKLESNNTVCYRHSDQGTQQNLITFVAQAVPPHTQPYYLMVRGMRFAISIHMIAILQANANDTKTSLQNSLQFVLIDRAQVNKVMRLGKEMKRIFY